MLILAILLYVMLDLSLPGMPGAFEFDPDDSVEGAQHTRVRAAAEAGVPPASAGEAFVLAQVPGAAQDRPAPSRPPSARPWMPRRCGAPGARPPSSGDPH
jgi:hypothetical protein